MLSEGEYPTLGAMGCLSSATICSLKKVPVVSVGLNFLGSPVWCQDLIPVGPFQLGISYNPTILPLLGQKPPRTSSFPSRAYPSAGSPSSDPSCTHGCSLPLLSPPLPSPPAPIPQFFSEPSIFLHGLECFEGKEIELNSEVRSLQAEGFNNHVLSVRVKGGM